MSDVSVSNLVRMLNLQFSHYIVDYRICQLAFTDCNVITIIFVIFVFDFTSIDLFKIPGRL